MQCRRWSDGTRGWAAVRAQALILAMGTGLAAGCGETTPPKPSVLPVASLSIISGDSQIAVVGTTLPQPVVARVFDAAGRPTTGQVVSFRIAAGGGSVFAGTSMSNAEGIVQEIWTVGTVAGQNRLEARAVDATTGAPLVFGVFTATAVPDAPDTLSIHAGNNQSVASGQAMPDSLAVRVSDRYGNAIPGLVVSWSITSGAGTLSAATSTTNASGIASTRYTAGTQAAAVRITATLGSRSREFGGTITPGPAAVFVKLGGDSQTVAKGWSPFYALVMRVTDAAGNPRAGDTVRLLRGALWSVLADPNPRVSGTDGSVQVGLWILETVGTHQLTATLGTLAPVVFTEFAVEPRQVSRKAVAGNGQTAPAGTEVPVRPELVVLDKDSLPVPGIGVAFFSRGDAHVTGDTVMTDANGRAKVGSWRLRTTSGIDTLVAQVHGLSPSLLFTATTTPP